VGPAALYVLGAGADARTFCAACAKATHPEWERCGLAVKHTACRRCGRKRYYQGSGLWPHAYCTEGCARHARLERRRRGRTRREGAGKDWNDALLTDYGALCDALEARGLVVAPARIPGDNG
jgi:hypothetical protein